MNLSPTMGTPLSPLSPQADATRFLILVTVGLSIVIVTLVTGLVAFAVIRYRDRGTGATPRQTGGNRKIEIAYTLIPLGIQVGLFILTVITMHRAEPAQSDRPPELVIIGHQWWWELRYPDARVVSANEIHLPVGRPIHAELRSGDVIHEVWIPQLGPKMDTVPGKPNQLVLQVNRAGQYLGDCAEFCGVEHAWMRLLVVAQTPADFATWEHQQSQPALASAATSSSQQRGKSLFQNQTCVQCHTIQGVSTEGNVGPDLTHFGSRFTLGAGVADNTHEQLALWLDDPQKMKPSCYMPKMQLTKSQVQDLTHYLEALK